MKKTLSLIVFLLISWGISAQFVADFTSNKTFGCAPLIIQFTDASSVDANKWVWTSTAEVSSNLQNPTLSFVTPGIYDVILESSNGSETKTDTMKVRVSPGITVDFSSTEIDGCVPFTTQLSDLSVPQSSAISSWFWSFSNGSTSTDQNPSVTFLNAGKFDVLLKITDDNGCEASYTKTDFLTAGGPVADFDFDSMACDIPAPVNFINISKGENLSHEWTFGNGNSASTEIPPEQTYSVYDTVPVTLYIKENSTQCADSVEKLMYIRKYEAKMEVTAVCNSANLSLNLKDMTEPSPISVTWNLGDGNENFKSEFSHVYLNNQSRTITLTAKIGASCINSTSFTYGPPQSKFTFSANNSCESPYFVNFINQSTGNSLSYTWEYGDTSAIDTAFENSHGYNVPPIVLTPKLSVVDTFGCQAISNQKPILIPIPIADFNAENERVSGCAPLTINFFNLSKKVLSTVKEIIWEYGDPNSGTLNIGKDSLSSHTFNTPGKYDITLIIILDNGCSDTILKKEFIRVGELPLTADFNINFKDTICYGETLSFEGLSSYSNPAYFSDFFCWAFEEDDTPVLFDKNNPPTQCPEGPSIYLPTDNYVHSQIPDHQYSNFKFEDASSVGGYNFLGNAVPSDSTLHTHLFVGFNGCYQEVIKPIHVVPAAAVIGFAYPDSIQDLVACDSSKTVGIYNASVSYDSLLYFRIIHEPTNDTVAHIAEFDTLYFKFDQPGDYSIQIGVYSKGEDCQNEVTRTFHVMDKNIKIDLPASLCLKNQIAAVDKSTYSKGSPISRSWSFQGALESSASYPALTNDTLKAQVIETGWNLVTLAVIVAIKSNSIGVGSPDAECEYVFEDSLFVEGTELKLKLDTNIACAGDTVLLTNLSTGTSAFQSIEWLLKDSSTVLNSTDSFKLAYDVPKTYVHSLVINSTFGCSDTLDSPELLVSIPILDYSASENVVCKGESVIFTNSSRGHELSNLWTIEGFNYLNIDASHTFVKVGTFDIKLLSTDRYGCQDSLTFPNYVRVAPFPKSEFSTLNINVNCPPFTIEFEDTSLTPAVEWEWKISDGGIGTSQNFLHTFVTAGKFDVEFTSTNKDGCTDALNKSNYITVVGPAATVAVSDTAICSPDSVKFNMVMTDVAYYVWDFNDGIIQSSALTSNSDSVSHIYSKAGLINPIFTVIDTADCVVVVPNIPAISVDSLNAEFEAQQLVSCNLDSLKLNNNSTSLFQSTFKWDFGNGNTWADSIGINKYTSPGDYDIKLMMKSSIGCEDTSTLSHTLHVGPSEKLTVTNDYFCVPTTTTLQLTYENSNFLLEDAFYTLESNKIKGDSISLAFTEAKLYSLSYEITYGDGNCKIDSTFTHVYFELPLAEFDFSPKNLSLQIPQIFFTNNSTNTTIWDWDFGDGKTQSLENPSHSYIEADKYTVQLIASNLGGCTDTAIIEIPMAPRDVIQLPNAFTPDGDGSNDEFGILFAGKIDLLSFKVLNRWGNLVFRTGDINEKWDGQYKGEPQNHGTYVYHVKGRNEMGEILEYKGNFSLIR